MKKEKGGEEGEEENEEDMAFFLLVYYLSTQTCFSERKTMELSLVKCPGSLIVFTIIHVERIYTATKSTKKLTVN